MHPVEVENWVEAYLEEHHDDVEAVQNEAVPQDVREEVQTWAAAVVGIVEEVAEIAVEGHPFADGSLGEDLPS